MIRKLLFGVIATLLLPALAWAQGTILQSGPVTPRHPAAWYQNGVQGDPGPASGALGVGISELFMSVPGSGTPPFANAGSGPFGTNGCDYDAPVTSPSGYHFFCWSPNAQGGGLFAYGAGGGASQLPFYFNLNGTTYQFPFSTSGIVGPVSTTVGDLAIWNNTAGTLLKDLSASAFLDSIFGNSVGSIICRGSSGWQGLAPGAAGQTLQSQGSSTCPTWANTGETVTIVSATGSTSISSATQTVVVKTNSASPVSLVLPASSNFPNCPSLGNSCPIITVKDASGDSSTGQISVTAADSKTIDGGTNYPMPFALQASVFVLTGNSWIVK